MIGAHKQLPPTIVHERLKQTALSVSLFDRLLDVYNPANPAMARPKVTLLNLGNGPRVALAAIEYEV